MTISGGVTPIRDGADVPAATVEQAPYAPSIVPYVATSQTAQTTINNFAPFTFIIDEYRSFQKGARVRSTSQLTGSWIEGVVVSSQGRVLVIRADRVYAIGVGPWTNWLITIAGEIIIENQILSSGEIVDATLVASTNLGVATFELKTLLGGNDPSPENPIVFQAPSGAKRVIRESVKLTIPYLATLNVLANEPFRLWFLLVDDVGFDVHLAVIQTRDPAFNIIHGFQGRAVVSTQSPPGNSSGVFYSDLAMTNKSYIVFGFADYDNGLATPGVWNVSPNRFTFYATGNPLPGDVIGITAKQVSSPVPAIDLIPMDNTVPQITEGVEFYGVDVLPNNCMSLFFTDAQAILATDVAVGYVACLFRSDRGDAMVSCWAGGGKSPIQLEGSTFLGHTNLTHFSLRAGRGAAIGMSLSLNGVGLTGYFGGTFNSFIRVVERMT